MPSRECPDSSDLRRVSWGAQGTCPPPLEIKKTNKKKVIRANVKLFHLYFATFLVENVIFSDSDFAPPPPPYKFLDTRLDLNEP